MATQEDVLQLMEFLAAEYSTFQVTQERAAIWAEALEAFSPSQLRRGAKHFLLHSGSEFGPSVSQVIKVIRDSEPRPERTTRKGLPEPQTDWERGLTLLRELRAKAGI